MCLAKSSDWWRAAVIFDLLPSAHRISGAQPPWPLGFYQDPFPLIARRSSQHLAQGSRALLEAGWGLVYWRLGPSALSLSSNYLSAWITPTVDTKTSVFSFFKQAGEARAKGTAWTETADCTKYREEYATSSPHLLQKKSDSGQEWK